MLKIYNVSGTFVRMIPDTDYQDATLTKTLADGDKQLEFTYTGDPRLILNEYYVATSEDRFVVKEVHPGDHATRYVCKLDLESLEKKIYQTFTASNKTITQAATSALSGTGWTVSTSITKKRSVQCLKKTPLEVLFKIRDAFMCEIEFDTINHVVYFKTQIGQDRGMYMRSDVNLRKLTPVYDSYDYYTRLIPIGADGLEINNGGKNYVENYSYSNKIRILIWEDTSYTDAAELMTDATAKLADLAVPKRSYSADVVDLARMRNSVLSFDLGDTIKITDETTGVMEKQRIVKMVMHLDEPEKNTVELSNTVLTWEEQQARLKAAADAWEGISNPDGSVNGVYVHGVQSGDVVGVEVTTGGSTVKKNLQEAVVIMQSDTRSASGAASAAATAAANALTTADGKNTVIYSASQPSTSGRKTGDIWFDTDDGNKMYSFANGAWSAKQFGQNAIAANSITANHITAGAVTAAKISVNSLSAISANMGSITAGTIQVTTVIDGATYTGVLRTSGGSAGADGGLRMFEIYKTVDGAAQSQFYVSTGGRLYARNAYVKGEIAADTGTIGGSNGWVISDRTIKSTSGGRTTGLQTPGMGTIGLAIGATSATDFRTAPFRVTHEGQLTANGAHLSAGIVDDTLYFGTGSSKPGISATGTKLRLNISASGDQIGASIESAGAWTHLANFYVQQGDTSLAQIAVRNEYRQGSLRVSANGTLGLLNVTASRWLIYDNGSDVYLPSRTYASGYMHFTATPILHNNVYLRGYDSADNLINLVGLSNSDNIWIGDITNFGRLTLAASIESIYCYDAAGSTMVKLKTTVSDARLKHDIEDLRDAKQFIMALHPKQFKYNGGDGTINFGFIAQEVRPVLEETYDGDHSLIVYNGNRVNRFDEDTFKYSMDYIQFIAPLVATVQEQERAIKSLTDDIMELRNLITDIVGGQTSWR